MNTAVNLERLKAIAQQLQEEVRSRLPSTPFQVQCAFKQESLLVLSQHPPDEDLNPQQVFAILEQALRSLPPQSVQEVTGLQAEKTPVKLYLRALGQKQPYATHPFLLELAVPSVEESVVQADNQLPEKQSVQEESSADPLPDLPSAPDPLPDPPLPDRGSVSSLATLDRQTVPASTAPVRVPPAQQKSLPWLAAGISVSLAAFLAGMFAVSRPCVFGTCEPLQMAQELSQKSLQSQQVARSQQDLQQAQQQMAQANQLLNNIPPWSTYRNDAQALLQTYQAQTTTLDQVLATEAATAAAIQQGQTLPQSVESWQGLQSTWRRAIAQLEAVPTGNPLQEFARSRLPVYRENLAAIDRYIAAEQQAHRQLMAAKTTAKTAEARQGIAQSMENWQLTRSTWQVAVNHLQQIPNFTTSYAQAQELLVGYQTRLAIARDRATQEYLSSRSFTQANRLAEQAKTLERQNQWVRAVATWQNALAAVKQVPPNTVFYEQAQPLTATYANSLKLAQARLQVAANLQRVRSDLDRICSGSPRICSYRITNTAIQLQFTSSYERALRAAFFLGRAGDPGTLGGTIKHIESLQAALQTVSNNAGVEIEVYGSDGSELIGSFSPEIQ